MGRITPIGGLKDNDLGPAPPAAFPKSVILVK